MDIKFNPSMKVTKRHMNILGKYIPVRQRGYPVRYWTCHKEYSNRRNACEAMLCQLLDFVGCGIYPPAVVADILDATDSTGQFPLFIQ